METGMTKKNALKPSVDLGLKKDALAEIATLQKSILELRMSLFQGSGKVKTSNFKKFRREIARIKTLHRL
jgi:ribosomal protein L29